MVTWSQQFVPFTVSKNQLDFQFLKCESFSVGHGKSYNLFGTLGQSDLFHWYSSVNKRAFGCFQAQVFLMFNLATLP